MHLDGKHLLRIQKLQQQREPRETPGQLSHRLFRKLRQHLADSLSLEWSIGDAARMVAAIAKYPSFPDRSVVRQRRGQQAGKAPAAPQPILIDRFELQWIKSHGAASYSPRRATLLQLTR